MSTELNKFLVQGPLGEVFRPILTSMTHANKPPTSATDEALQTAISAPTQTARKRRNTIFDEAEGSAGSVSTATAGGF